MKKTTGVVRIIKAFGYSMRGFGAAYTCEAAFRQEVWLTIVLVPCGIWLGNTPAERGLLVAVVLLVPLVELLNSAIEATLDRIGAENHPLTARAKDMGSAAVLLSICIAVVVWVAVLLPM